MILHSLQATFGGLEGAKLELKPGFNLLPSGNETGKSTWSRFIRAMFYGISTAERSRQGSLADKVRYLPWSGAPMEGRMDLTLGEREVTLFRSAVGVGKPFGNCTAVYADTGEKIPELQGADAGERMLGITEAVFRRSAYLSGSELRIDPDRDLEKRLLRLVTSGEELSSAREAEERLHRWQRKRRWRNSGALPEAERGLEEKESALRRMEDGAAHLAALRRDRDRLAEDRAALKLELRLHQRDALLEQRRRLAAAELEARELGERAEALETRRAGRTRQTADALRAAALRLEEAEKDRSAMERTLNEAREQAEALPDPEGVPRQPGRGLGTVLIVLGAVLAVLGILALAGVVPGLPDWLKYILTACVLLLVPGVLRLVKVGKREAELRQERLSERERAEARIQELERQLGLDTEETESCRSALEESKKAALCAPEEDPMSAADRLDALVLELEQTRSGASAAAQLAKTLSASLGEEPEELEGEVTLSREEAERRLGETEYSLRETERSLDREEVLFGLLGDPLVLASQAEALRDVIRQKEAELSALDLAEQALVQAGKEMQSRFAPLVSKEAGELLRGFTGGRYTGIFFDRDLHFSVQPAEDLQPRSLEYLSEGTKNQVYLAVRLAICRLALPAEDPCPLILDDVLLTFDDVRAERALRVLLELSEERQILFFTCSGREREMLARMGKEEVCLPQ